MQPRAEGPRPRLRPTYSHSRAASYRREGGPWDRGGLDASFPAVDRRRTNAVVDDRCRLDGAALEKHLSLLRDALYASGVRARDVVSWQLPNGACALALYRACWRLGAIAAPVHHRLGRAETEAALAQVDPVLVIASKGSPASDLPVAVVVEGAGELAALETMLESRSGRATPVRHLVRGSRPPAGPRGSDIAVALFTSGSTGVPKAVMHTHRALGYKAFTMLAVHGLGANDAVLMPAPLAHVSGLLNGVLIPAAAGIPSVLMASWDPELAVGHIEHELVSFMGAPPIFFSQMANETSFSPRRVRSMRLISTGGASVSPSLVQSTAEEFGCRVKRTYGSTEAPTVTTSGPDDDIEKARDTDGRGVGEVEVEIHDPASGVRLATRGPGEIWLRGPELFVGYVDPGATEKAIARPGGWFRTGDLGTLDEAGWLKVVGRLSDVVIRAGENISASEVEAVLESHPAVRHAVAVGVPDEELGERLAALVEADAAFDLETCRSWFAEKGITRFKTPELVVRLEKLPLLAAGKADRVALRKIAVEAARSRNA